MGCVEGGREGGEARAGFPFWARPWRLKASVVHQWRAHRERLRGQLADEDQAVVITAGWAQLGGKDAEVLRCWSLADASAGGEAS